MSSFLLRRKVYFVMLAGIMLLILLAACGSATSNGSSSTATSNSSSATHVNATPTVTESALIKEMTFVGSPTAKIVSGTTYEVNGKIKNGDDKRHDIYVKVALLDATGKLIATTTENVDDVAGGATVTYSIQGTTPQAIWANVQVSVVKVTENIGGSGSD
jgi:hypothetical protein